MSNKKNILILGATGSIGVQTLDVCKKHSDKFNVVGLVAYSSKEKLEKSAQDFDVKKTHLVSSAKNNEDSNAKIKEMVFDDEVDIVVNAMSGAAGLLASYWSLQAEKTLALANKESLVVGGDILMPMANALKEKFGVEKLLPIDSEHGAIFQCLIGEEQQPIYKIWITASGGPFYGKQIDDLENITKEQALAHPTWNMGPKITIDSSTLMNKGLEVIEAHHLFGVGPDKIKVVVQPQSAIHSMVEFMDGSVKAHLGTTNMEIPIQFALSYPQRLDTPVERMDFTKIGQLDFGKPDLKTFKCLQLAFDALGEGGSMPCIMNAANEVAVAKFLKEQIFFLDIAKIVEQTMHKAKSEHLFVNKIDNIDQILDIDKKSRILAQDITSNL